MMPTKKQKTVSQFLKDNLWNIFVAVFAAAIAFIWVKADIISLNYRLGVAEAKQAEYPSQDWFELKFKTIDEKFVILENKIDNCQNRL